MKLQIGLSVSKSELAGQANELASATELKIILAQVPPAARRSYQGIPSNSLILST